MLVLMFLHPTLTLDALHNLQLVLDIRQTNTETAGSVHISTLADAIRHRFSSLGLGTCKDSR